MKRCQSCGYPIVGKAREDAPESVSGARPTLYWHETGDECTAAKEERIASPLQPRLKRI